MMTEECVFPDEDVASIPSHRFNMYGAEVMLVAIMLPKQLSIVAGGSPRRLGGDPSTGCAWNRLLSAFQSYNMNL